MRALALASVVIVAVGCGGESSDDGSGGAGGSSGSGGSTGGSAGSTGGSGGSTGGSGGSTGGSAGSTGGSAGSAGADCKALGETMQATLTAAQQCSPLLGVEQCNGTAVGYDSCGCGVVLNDTQPDKVKAANDAYDAWVAAGCGPNACGKACFESPNTMCDPASSTCQWSTG
jgi:hypothetical protein